MTLPEPFRGNEYAPAPHVRLTLQETGPGRAIVRRHRVNPALAGEAATVEHAGGVVQAIKWNPDERASLEEWITLAEHWVKEELATSWVAP